jgi:hypothetical protein
MIDEHEWSNNPQSTKWLQQLHILTENDALEGGIYSPGSRLMAVITGVNRARGALREPYVAGQLDHLEHVCQYIEKSADTDVRNDIALDASITAIDWLLKQQ